MNFIENANYFYNYFLSNFDIDFGHKISRNVDGTLLFLRVYPPAQKFSISGV
jgi:hypothetical protein